jgi:hypothetical protein
MERASADAWEGGGRAHGHPVADEALHGVLHLAHVVAQAVVSAPVASRTASRRI